MDRTSNASPSQEGSRSIAQEEVVAAMVQAFPDMHLHIHVNVQQPRLQDGVAQTEVPYPAPEAIPYKAFPRPPIKAPPPGVNLNLMVPPPRQELDPGSDVPSTPVTSSASRSTAPSTSLNTQPTHETDHSVPTNGTPDAEGHEHTTSAEAHHEASNGICQEIQEIHDRFAQQFGPECWTPRSLGKSREFPQVRSWDDLISYLAVWSTHSVDIRGVHVASSSDDPQNTFYGLLWSCPNTQWERFWILREAHKAYVKGACFRNYPDIKARLHLSPHKDTVNQMAHAWSNFLLRPPLHTYMDDTQTVTIGDLKEMCQEIQDRCAKGLDISCWTPRSRVKIRGLPKSASTPTVEWPIRYFAVWSDTVGIRGVHIVFNCGPDDYSMWSCSNTQCERFTTLHEAHSAYVIGACFRKYDIVMARAHIFNEGLPTM